MPDLLTVTKPPDYKLEVGSQGENYIALEITAAESMAKFNAFIAIPCGDAASGQSYLCADGKRANLILSSEPADKLKFQRQETKTKIVSWKSNDVSLHAGEKVILKITGFNPESAGNASIQLKFGNPKPFSEEFYAVTITAAPGPAILYFDVSPTNVVQKGEVNIIASTTGAETVKLFADTIEIMPTSSGPNATRTVTKYKDAPQGDTTYLLKAWQKKPGRDDQADVTAKVTVSVTPRPGWYSWDLVTSSLERANVRNHYHPTLLLSAKDLSGETVGDRLYGVFFCKETKQAELWSSSSGVDGWSFLGNVPDGMAESPGVIHNRALWLIGGVSTDPLGNVSNRVCWYYKNKDQEMVWKEWDEDGSQRKTGKTPTPRRCHACAAFNGKVWLLGGLSAQNNTLNEVWACSADPAGGNFTAAWEPSQPLPSARCFSVVTTTPASKRMKLSQPRLWLCGGTTHPYNLDETFYDLFWTEDGKNWKALDLPEQTGKTNIVGATIFYDDNGQRLHLAGMFRVHDKGIKTFDYELTDVSAQDSWRDGSLAEFGWDSSVDLFQIRSVSFRERWIFSPMYQDWSEIESYRARIYITPIR